MIRSLTIACVVLLAFVVAASAQSFTPDPIDMAAAKREGAVKMLKTRFNEIYQ